MLHNQEAAVTDLIWIRSFKCHVLTLTTWWSKNKIPDPFFFLRGHGQSFLVWSEGAFSVAVKKLNLYVKKPHSIVPEAEFKYKTCLSDGTYSRAPCVAPWCVAARCTGLFRARTRWSRSTSPSHKRAPLKMDIPPSCKHTRPWRGQLGPVRIQHQNRTTFPCSLEKKGGGGKKKKKQLFSCKCSKSGCSLSLKFQFSNGKKVSVVKSREAEYASAAGLAVRKFSQTNAPGSKRDTGVKQADALTRFGENLSSHAEQTQFVVGHAVAVTHTGTQTQKKKKKKNTEKALMRNLSQCFKLL